MGFPWHKKTNCISKTKFPKVFYSRSNLDNLPDDVTLILLSALIIILSTLMVVWFLPCGNI